MDFTRKTPSSKPQASNSYRPNDEATKKTGKEPSKVVSLWAYVKRFAIDTYRKNPSLYIAVFILAGIIIIALPYTKHNATKTLDTNTSVSSTDRKIGKLTKGEPEFDALIPDGKTIDQLGGWTVVSPPDSDPAYSFADYIDGVKVIVSQQKMPEGISEDGSLNIDQIAAGYNANEKLNVGGKIVHLGSSSKGPQSLITEKSGLLILIKSTSKIDNDSWTAYINSLN